MRLVTSSFGQRQFRADSVQSKPWITTIIIVALAGIFALDRSIANAPIQHLYYVPILLAALAFGRRGGISAASAAIVLYHLANKPLFEYRYAESDIIQVVLFLVMGLIAARLNEDAKRMRHLAMTDDLTGLHNLRSFEVRLTEMIRESRYDHTPISLLVLDVDRLKSLNDIYGHLCGAEAVRTVGLIIAENVPRDAVACRYGGDEFAIALPRCLSSQARCFAERIRVAVDARPAILSGHDLPAGTLSVSIGYATNVAGPGNCTQDVDRQWGEELFRSSDRALYAAKTNGRNLVSAPPPAPPTCNIRICRFDPAAGRAIIPSRG